MEIKRYSKHFVSDGKYDLSVTVSAGEIGFETQDLRDGLKRLIDSYYHTDAATIAKVAIEEILGAMEVEIRELWGPTLILRKEA